MLHTTTSRSWVLCNTPNRHNIPSQSLLQLCLPSFNHIIEAFSFILKITTVIKGQSTRSKLDTMQRNARTLIPWVEMETKTVNDGASACFFFLLFFHHCLRMRQRFFPRRPCDISCCFGAITQSVPSKLPIAFARFFSLQFSPHTFAAATARSLSKSRFLGDCLALPVFTGLSL